MCFCVHIWCGETCELCRFILYMFQEKQGWLLGSRLLFIAISHSSENNAGALDVDSCRCVWNFICHPFFLLHFLIMKIVPVCVQTITHALVIRHWNLCFWHTISQVIISISQTHKHARSHELFVLDYNGGKWDGEWEWEGVKVDRR